MNHKITFKVKKMRNFKTIFKKILKILTEFSEKKLTVWPYGICFCFQPIRFFLKPRPSCCPVFNMAASKAAEIPKLFAITLIRSGIRRPYWEKRTLKALGLTKLHKTVIHKNSPSVNGQLNAVKHLISIKPVEVVLNSESGKAEDDIERSCENKSVFLRENGSFDLDKYLQHSRNEAKSKSKSPDYSIVG